MTSTIVFLLRRNERTLGSQGSWTSLEDYVSAPTFVWYNESSDYGWLPGHWLSALDPPGEGEMVYQDRFGVQVAGDFNPQVPAQPLPEYIIGCSTASLSRFGLYLCQFQTVERGTDWCASNQQSSNAVDCQSCCDQKLLDNLKRKLKPKQIKDLSKCLEEKCRGAGDADSRVECFRGCLTEVLGPLGALPIHLKLKTYLECCYGGCLPSGKFSPPGNCKLPF